MPRPLGASSDQWEDILPLLDQELGALPEKYRIPIVLCDLEGKGRKEVAGILGCPEGTLSSRLARARTALAQRLSRRGVRLSGGALGALVAANGASAYVPAPLAISTTKAAMLVAAGQAMTVACASLNTAALAEGVGKTMLFAKLKLTALWCGVAALGIGLGGVLYQTRAASGAGAGANRNNETVDAGGRPSHTAEASNNASNESHLEPNSKADDSSNGVAGNAAKRLRTFEARTAAIQAKAEAEIQALRDKLIGELETLQDRVPAS